MCYIRKVCTGCGSLVSGIYNQLVLEVLTDLQKKFSEAITSRLQSKACKLVLVWGWRARAPASGWSATPTSRAANSTPPTLCPQMTGDKHSILYNVITWHLTLMALEGGGRRWPFKYLFCLQILTHYFQLEGQRGSCLSKTRRILSGDSKISGLHQPTKLSKLCRTSRQCLQAYSCV